ncbi:MAG: fliN 2 [Proteobacteria bacterium]|nr:fliN 2 [Pseudomonadota bacterium]
MTPADEPSGIDLESHVADRRRGDDGEDQAIPRSAAELEAVFDVPVRVSAILGRTRLGVTARSAKPSTSTSTTALSPVAKWCWSKTSSA